MIYLFFQDGNSKWGNILIALLATWSGFFPTSWWISLTIPYLKCLVWFNAGFHMFSHMIMWSYDSLSASVPKTEPLVFVQVKSQNRAPIPFHLKFGFKVESEKSLLEMFREATFDDLWCDCSDMRDVLLYCRGSKRLTIPSEWRPDLPTHLWGLRCLRRLLRSVLA